VKYFENVTRTDMPGDVSDYRYSSAEEILSQLGNGEAINVLY
jgi:hypothetical protein